MIIKKFQQEEIVRCAKEALPHEVCGILAGKEGAVEKIYPMKNVSDTPELCYFMDAQEQLKVMKEIRTLGLEMLSIYHSHPGSKAYPSPRDVELAFYPEAMYLIVSLENADRPELKGFKIIDGKIKEELYASAD